MTDLAREIREEARGIELYYLKHHDFGTMAVPVPTEKLVADIESALRHHHAAGMREAAEMAEKSRFMTLAEQLRALAQRVEEGER